MPCMGKPFGPVKKSLPIFHSHHSRCDKTGGNFVIGSLVSATNISGVVG